VLDASKQQISTFMKKEEMYSDINDTLIIASVLISLAIGRGMIQMQKSRKAYSSNFSLVANHIYCIIS